MSEHKPKTGIPPWVMYFLGAGGFIMAGIICVLGYWLVDRDPPLIAVSGRFLGWDDQVARRGHVKWGGIQTRSECEGTIYRYIVNGEMRRLEPRKWEYRGPIDNMGSDQKPIPTTWDAPFDVPEDINHDASYRNRILFICNPVHKLWPIPINPPDVPFYLREEDKVLPYLNGNPPAPQAAEPPLTPAERK